METIQNIRPRLIEPGVKYFLSASLEQCHIFKNKYNNKKINNTRKVIFIKKKDSPR